MKHKVSELSAALLDAAVAKALDWPWHIVPESESRTGAELMMAHDGRNELPYHFSRDWEDGGPILDREDIQLGGYGTSRFAEIRDDAAPWIQQWGETTLIAAMRAYVAAKLGEEVELP